MKKKLCAIVCMILSFVLMAQPNAIPMTFGPSPTKRVTTFYSYFSRMPLGYGNWCPVIIILLSAIVTVLLLISLKKDVNKAIIGCLTALILASFASWVLYGAFCVVSALICALHVAALCCQPGGRRGGTG